MVGSLSVDVSGTTGAMGRAEKLDHKKHGKDYSFSTKRFKSNIDLFTTKGIETDAVQSPEDIWTGNTQHRPIMTTLCTKQKHGGRESQ